ncbi:nicotinate (nicotinamide) nucleotide adenylyltransferase [Candidatus Endobugula sertula]|uniref:Probable nicotinate-nucleotide adenylyltransferase n=1 Tax=Candidatus Endobugula sertula TaxID=62101 RepID=A0A1D2QQD1_9GAMM|nr:nicotinate (nicotinamide) nucleotide adenylyltransferase [Candidatus Endobugula sertula]
MAIGIFGGTFDPVHNAHLQMALEAKSSLRLDEVRLVPCHRPPHRDSPTLSSEQRLELLYIAIRDLPGLVIDERELKRDHSSYTVDTLLSFREELGQEISLVLMVGLDAFIHLTQWYQWQRLRKLAHIAVMLRPGCPLPNNGILAEWLSMVDAQTIIHQQAAGGLLLLEQSLLPISATAIRQQLAEGQLVNNTPPLVAEYLQSLKFKWK